MLTTHLRKVGGSTMLAVPPSILDLLHLYAGARVGLAVDHGCLVIDPAPHTHYRLEELLAQCDASLDISEEDHTWLSNKPSGCELL